MKKTNFFFLLFFLIFISGCFRKDNIHCVNYVSCDICIDNKDCNDGITDISLKAGENECFIMSESEIVKLEKLNCKVNVNTYFADEYMEKYKFEEFDKAYLVTLSDFVEQAENGGIVYE